MSTESPLTTSFDRRRALALLIGGSGVVLGVCAGSSGGRAGGSSTSSTSSATRRTTTATETAAEDCPTEIPEETAGPFPADGSNGPDVLTQDGVVRSDIRSSFGDASGTADGVPSRIVAAAWSTSATAARRSPAPRSTRWHCDREGRYSPLLAGRDRRRTTCVASR